MEQYDPVYNFHSEQCGIDIEMSDSYKTRNDILSLLHSHANNWLGLALARAPIVLQATLQVNTFLVFVLFVPLRASQDYLVANQNPSTQSVELGASIALQFASSIGPAERKIGK